MKGDKAAAVFFAVCGHDLFLQVVGPHPRVGWSLHSGPCSFYRESKSNQNGTYVPEVRITQPLQHGAIEQRH